MIDMQEAIRRLNNLGTDNSRMFNMMLIMGEESLIQSINKNNTQLLEHFVHLSKMEDDVRELIENENVWNNLLEVLPAEMAVEPTIGFQLVKDVLTTLGFESREQFKQWVEEHPNTYLNLLRSSITCIQAYFDLNRVHESFNEGSSVIDFIFNATFNQQTNEEQEALGIANNVVNEYLWGMSV